MPSFEYQGRTSEGKSIHGMRLSQSIEILASQLIREGITPVNITLQKEIEKNKNYFQNFFSPDQIKIDELAVFCRQMATLLKSGVPITMALRQLSENARSPYFSTVLNSLIEGLESGRELVDSMRNYPKIFSPIMLSMVSIGQSSGNLDEAFLRLNQYLELESSALNNIKTVLRYPSFVVLAIISAFTVVTGWVIPTFANIFLQANVSLPIFTRILMGLSAFLLQYWWLILIILIGIFFFIYRWLQTTKGKLQWGSWQLKIPVVGKIMRRVILLRFTQSFSMVIGSGISLLDGIKLVSETTGNAYAAHEIASLCDSIEHGLSLTRAAAATKLFTPLEIQMLSVSEETGELAAMLDHIAEYYRREVTYDLKRLSDIIEPVVMILLGVIVLILAFAVYLPIWDMVKLTH